MKDSGSLKIGIGTPTILMIFVVLCMVILSVLSFQEADHNMMLAEKEKNYVTNYYEAKAKANQIANELQNLSIKDIQEKHDLIIKEDQSSYQYQCSIDKKKEINVVLDKDNLDFITFQVRNRKGV